MRATRTTIKDALALAELYRPSWPTISAGIAASGAPTCHTAEADLTVKLKAVEAELSEAREEQAVLRREADRTRADFAKSPDADPTSSTFKRAKAASELLAESVQKIEGLQAVQIGTLKMLGKDGRAGHDGRGADTPIDEKTPGAWLSAVIRGQGGGDAMALASPLTAPDFGSVDATDKLFFRRLEQRSALLASGIAVVDIDTSSIKVGEVTGDMEPAVPTAQTDPIAKSDVPLEDREVVPPKFPTLVSLSTEAYNDARPIRVAALESKMLQAIGVGFDAAGFHGADKSLHPGLAHIEGVAKVEVDKEDIAYDWAADAIGDLLDVSGQPALMFLSPFSVRSLLKLKDEEKRYRIADLQAAASALMGVPVKITRGVEDGEGFVVDLGTLVIIRRQEVQTEVFEGFDVEHALVGIRTMMRAQLIAVDPRGTVHVTGLPEPEAEP